MDFPHCGQVFRLERTVKNLNGTKLLHHEVVHGIASLTPDEAPPAEMLDLVRGHWRIESNHWVRDVTFDEDRSQVRKKDGPRVMASFRNLAMNLFRLARTTNVAAAQRLCCCKPQIALRLIGL